jgi:hypothetical protein
LRQAFRLKKQISDLRSVCRILLRAESPQGGVKKPSVFSHFQGAHEAKRKARRLTKLKAMAGGVLMS